MVSHTSKSNNPQQLEQDFIKQEWELLCAIHAKKVQQSELEDQLVRLRHIKEYRGL